MVSEERVKCRECFQQHQNRNAHHSGPVQSPHYSRVTRSDAEQGDKSCQRAHERTQKGLSSASYILRLTASTVQDPTPQGPLTPAPCKAANSPELCKPAEKHCKTEQGWRKSGAECFRCLLWQSNAPQHGEGLSPVSAGMCAPV